MHRSRRPLIATAVAVVAGVVTLVLALTPAAGATGRATSRCGDSYSSGVGSGSYITSSGACLRSTQAYSQLWANAHAPSSYASVACSGRHDDRRQRQPAVRAELGTTLVSITIGGNDVGFSGVMEDCVLYGTSTCVSEVNAAEARPAPRCRAGSTPPTTASARTRRTPGSSSWTTRASTTTSGTASG